MKATSSITIFVATIGDGPFKSVIEFNGVSYVNRHDYPTLLEAGNAAVAVISKLRQTIHNKLTSNHYPMETVK